jgi:hypothetical protein
LNGKYQECFDLCTKMSQRPSHNRPNCEEILNRKYSWAMSRDFEIDEELKKELIPKLVGKNQLIFSILKSKLNI